MQYISPFSLLGIDVKEISQNPNTLNVSVLKKRMLAEFELSKSVTIETPSGELSKNDVLVIFEQLQSPEILNYHLQIAQDAFLLEFLQYNALEGGFTKNPIYSNEEFLVFISPYFANSYCSLVINILETDGASNPHLFKIPLLLSPGEESKLLQPIRRKIYNYIAEIENYGSSLKNKNAAKLTDSIYKIYSFNVIRILNILNNNIFEHDIEAFIKASIDLATNCINEKNNGFRNEEAVSFILKRTQMLPLSSENEKKINHYLAFINREVQYVESTEKKGSGGGIISIIVVIVAVIRIATIGSSHHSSSSDNSFLQQYQTLYAPDTSNEDDSTKALRIFKRLRRGYLDIYNKSKGNSLPSYSSYKTGENPYSGLNSMDIQKKNKKYRIKFVNRSNKNVLTILNTVQGNAYFFINKKENITIGINSQSANVFFIAGKEWDSSFYIPEPIYAGEKIYNERIYGHFNEVPTNAVELLNNTSFGFPEINTSKKAVKIASFTFTTTSDSCIKVEKILPPIPSELQDNTSPPVPVISSDN
jgi:hypothetical protein